MRGLFRRRRLPAARRPILEPDERIVAWATVSGDDVVVATTRGLWLPGRSDRLGWHEIHKAVWSGRDLTLVASHEVEPADGYTVVVDQPAARYTLLDPDDVPSQVRNRVMKSIADTRHHPLPGGGVRVVARRVPGVDGLRWTVRYDEGVDPAAAEIRAATADLVGYGRSIVEGAVT
jgi:hypothetical protein